MQLLDNLIAAGDITKQPIKLPKPYAPFRK